MILITFYQIINRTYESLSKVFFILLKLDHVLIHE